MENKKLARLNVTYFHRYNMYYDLIASHIQREMNVNDLKLHHFSDLKSLLDAVNNNKIDVMMVNSSCLFDGFFRETEIRGLLSALYANKNIVTVCIAQKIKTIFLKKMVQAGVDIIISINDSPSELVSALTSIITLSNPKPYISPTLKKDIDQITHELTTKEWEVINLINQGYSLSQIASKKCRAMSTVSTQKRNAMNKLNIKSESELIYFLNQNNFFNY